MENYFCVRKLKSPNDVNFHKVLLKDFFKWSDDTEYAIDNDIEIIIGEKFIKSKSDIEYD